MHIDGLKETMIRIGVSLIESANDESDMSSYLSIIKDYEFIMNKYGEFDGVRIWFEVGDPSICLDTTTNEMCGETTCHQVFWKLQNAFYREACDTINRIFKEIYKNEIQNKS